MTKTWLALGAGVILVCVGSAYLFRQKTLHTDVWGDIRLVWRWGKAAEQWVDWDKDGMEDSLLVYHRWSTQFSTHEVPDEILDDTLRRGRFDLHVTFADGVVRVLQRDHDGDGHFEERLAGEEAREAYSRYLATQHAFHKRRLGSE